MPPKSTQRPTRRRSIPAGKDLLLLQKRFGEYYGVRGSFIGQKRVKGRYTASVGLVCIVDKKQPPAKLRNSQKIPRRVRIEAGKTGPTIATDVIQKHGGIRLQSFNPGDRLRGRRSNGSPATATIGAFGLHAQHGPLFVTAGHFAEEAGGGKRQVELDDAAKQAATVKGTIVRFRVAGGIDYALVKSTDPNARGHNAPLRSIYHPVLKSDIGRTLFVLARGMQIRTVCRGLNFNYMDPGTGKEYTQLIVTDAVTKGGDSGGALVDADFRLWGLLIGVAHFKNTNASAQALSVYMPIVRLLGLENIVIGDAT